MARFCALPKCCGRAGTSEPALCALPEQGAALVSWGMLSTVTPPAGRDGGMCSRRRKWFCALAPLSLAAGKPFLPAFVHRRGLVRFPTCLLLLHGHGEAEVRMHVCCISILAF